MADFGSNSEQPTGALRQTHGIPPPQHPYEQAFELGFESLLSRRLTDDFLNAVGAERRANAIRLPALNRYLLVDTDSREVLVEGVGRARLAWAILALHHLCADDASLDTREVSLAHFPDCRGYLSVFNNRIVRRFLATSGKDPEVFSERAERVGGVPLCPLGAESGAQVAAAVGYRFDVFPRVPIVIVRYAGDDELGPGASVVYRADAYRLLPAEDRIVAAELVLDALSGRSMEEPVVSSEVKNSGDSSLRSE